MKPYRALAFLLLNILSACTLAAQDRIFLSNNRLIEGRVTAASIIRVKYQQYSGEDTVTHSIPGAAVESIEYEDGRTWRLNHSRAHTKQQEEARLRRAKRLQRAEPFIKKGYSNVITLHAPHLQVIHGLGAFNLGLEYERFLDKKGRFSLFVPVYLRRDVSDYFGRWGGIHSGETLEFGKAFYTGPGCYYHPFGNRHRVDIGIGAQYTFGSFSSEKTKYDYVKKILEPSDYSISTLSAELNIRFQSKGHFVCGFYGGYGISLASGRRNPALFQLGFKLGGRF